MVTASFLRDGTIYSLEPEENETEEDCEKFRKKYEEENGLYE